MTAVRDTNLECKGRMNLVQFKKKLYNLLLCLGKSVLLKGYHGHKYLIKCLTVYTNPTQPNWTFENKTVLLVMTSSQIEEKNIIVSTKKGSKI